MTQYVVLVSGPPVPNRVSVEAVVVGPFASHNDAQQWVVETNAGRRLARKVTLIIPLMPQERF